MTSSTLPFALFCQGMSHAWLLYVRMFAYARHTACHSTAQPVSLHGCPFVQHAQGTRLLRFDFGENPRALVRKNTILAKRRRHFSCTMTTET